jgi:hypothetical protein
MRARDRAPCRFLLRVLLRNPALDGCGAARHVVTRAASHLLMHVDRLGAGTACRRHLTIVFKIDPEVLNLVEEQFR